MNLIQLDDPLAQLPFPVAAEKWLNSRKPYLSPRTVRDYENYIKTLSPFFGEMRLCEIDADLIRAYQRARMMRCGASVINHECSTIEQMLKRIGRWPEIVRDYQPLPLPLDSPGKALNPDEEARLRAAAIAALDEPQWMVAACCILISLHTTMGPGEIRNLRLKDVHLDSVPPRIEVVEGAKNCGRARPLPLTPTPLDAVKQLLKRARDLKSFAPEHYLIPFRVSMGKYDPTRPASASFIKTSFRQIIVNADLHMRQYDLRHHAITCLLEDPDVSDEAAEAVAGHISARMKRKYSHTRLHVKMAALMKLERKSLQQRRARTDAA